MNKYLRNHLKLIIVLAIFVVIVLGAFIAYNMIFVNTSTKYGSRLDGIENVRISDNTKNDIKKNIETLEITNSITIRLSGKTINVITIVKDDTEVGKAKEISGKITEKLSEEQKKYYDIQVLISKKNDDSKFPIIGYKHHTKDYYSWTKER